MTLTSFGPANRIARSAQTHPLTWRLRDDGEPVWLDEYQAKDGAQVRPHIPHRIHKRGEQHRCRLRGRDSTARRLVRHNVGTLRAAATQAHLASHFHPRCVHIQPRPEPRSRASL